MSRRQKESKEIQNPEHYFNRYVSLEVLHTRIKQYEYEERNESLDERLAGGEDGLSHEAREMMVSNCDADSLEKEHKNRSFLAWIDYIENPRLHKAIQELTEDQKIYLTLRFHLCCMRSEICP